MLSPKLGHLTYLKRKPKTLRIAAPKMAKLLRRIDWQDALAVIAYVILALVIHQDWLPTVDAAMIHSAAFSILP